MREMTAPDFPAEDKALVARMKEFLGHIEDMGDDERVFMLGALTGALDRRLAVPAAAEGLVRQILEALCERDGLSLESAADPGSPARNYELADRLRIGRVFGLRGNE